MSEQTENTPNSASNRTKAGATTAIVGAALLDLIFVVGFAASGRSQHGEAATLAGLWSTAWPFLAGLLLTWLLASVWRRPVSVLRSGLPIWVGTVALGMVLRVSFTNGGAALPFVLVAAGTLGLTLVGWRLIVALVRKLRSGKALRA